MRLAYSEKKEIFILLPVLFAKCFLSSLPWRARSHFKVQGEGEKGGKECHSYYGKSQRLNERKLIEVLGLSTLNGRAYRWPWRTFSTEDVGHVSVENGEVLQVDGSGHKQHGP